MLYLNQEIYLKKILQEVQMINKSSKFIKMLMNGESCIYLIGPEDKQIDRKSYQKKIKLIMYTAINIRLDIVFIIGKLSQYVVDLARHHEQAIKYLM